jgi:hypothetical protein
MTKRRALVLAVVVIAALAVWAWWSADRGEAGDIQRLANLVARQEDATLKQEAEAVARKYKDLRPLMRLFKERTREGGGLGVAEKPGSVQPDGIEKKIRALAAAAPSEAELDEQRDALVRMAQVTAAIAAVTRHKCEVKQKTGYLDPKDWARWSEGVQQSSHDLAEAVGARDGSKVKAAAADLCSNCTNCHRIFRE